MNPVGIGPNSPKMIAALSKLKWLVVGENHEIETANFWKAPKEYGTQPASQIQTEVFQLPASTFAEKDGSFTNSARWIQWKWKALDPPGQAKSDQEILSRIFLAVRELYRKEGGALPEAVLNIDWSYSNPAAPDLAECLKELNGKALGGPPRSEGQDEGPQDRRPAARRLRPAAGRRLHDVRQLADVRLLHGGRQPDPAPQPGRLSVGAGHVPQLDLLLAGQPASHVQPGVGGRTRGSPGIRRGSESSGTGKSGWATFPT